MGIGLGIGLLAYTQTLVNELRRDNREIVRLYAGLIANVVQDDNDASLDFVFENITSNEERQKLKKFIKRHEWLGTLSQYTTQWFACYHKNILAG